MGGILFVLMSGMPREILPRVENCAHAPAGDACVAGLMQASWSGTNPRRGHALGYDLICFDFAKRTYLLALVAVVDTESLV